MVGCRQGADIPGSIEDNGGGSLGERGRGERRLGPAAALDQLLGATGAGASWRGTDSAFVESEICAVTTRIRSRKFRPFSARTARVAAGSCISTIAKSLGRLVARSSGRWYEWIGPNPSKRPRTAALFVWLRTSALARRRVSGGRRFDQGLLRCRWLLRFHPSAFV